MVNVNAANYVLELYNILVNYNDDNAIVNGPPVLELYNILVNYNYCNIKETK